MLNDIARCTNAGCPFNDCERHIAHCKEGATYTFVNFAGICRRYISSLVDGKLKSSDLIKKEVATKRLKVADSKRLIGNNNVSYNFGASDGFRESISVVDKTPTVKEAGFDYLVAWYISSVSDEDKPIWTEEHIEELLKDFIVIPREQESEDL